MTFISVGIAIINDYGISVIRTTAPSVASNPVSVSHSVNTISGATVSSIDNIHPSGLGEDAVNYLHSQGFTEAQVNLE